MGRKKKQFTNRSNLDTFESFNLAHALRDMAKAATDAPHIKAPTIQAAGLREYQPAREVEEVETDNE